MTDHAASAHRCTLDARSARVRLPQVHGLTARLRDRRRVDDRLVLRFEDDGDTTDLVEEFVRDESQCCSFFGFDVRHDDGEVVLELSAPAEAGHMLDAAMTSFDPALADTERLQLFHEHAASGVVAPDTE